MSSEQRALPSRSHLRLSRPNSRVPSSLLPVCRQSPPTARVVEASRSGGAGQLRSGVKSLQSDSIVARRGRLPISLPADDGSLSSSSPCLVAAVEEVIRPGVGSVGRGGFGQSPRSPVHTARSAGRISSHIPISPGHKSTSPGVFRFSSTMHHSSSTSPASSGRAEVRGSPSTHQPLRRISSPTRASSSADAHPGPRGERLSDALGSAVREGLRGFSPVSALSRRWYDWKTSAAISHTQSPDEDKCSASSAAATVPSSPAKKRVVNSNTRPVASADSSACGFMSTCPAPPSVPSPLLSPTSGVFPPMIPSPLLLSAAVACCAPPVAVDVVDLAGSVVVPCVDEAAEDVEIKKTMGFQITSVTQSRLPSEEEDSDDDEPSGVVELLAASSLQLVGEAAAAAAAEEANSWQSRFRIINIQTGVPFWRGRWQCVDYLDRQQQPTSPCPSGSGDAAPSSHAFSLPSLAYSASSTAARTSPHASEQLQLGASPPRQLQLLALHCSLPQTGGAASASLDCSQELSPGRLDSPQDASPGHVEGLQVSPGHIDGSRGVSPGHVEGLQDVSPKRLDGPQDISPGHLDDPADVPTDPTSFFTESELFLRQSSAPILDMLPAPAPSSTQSASPTSSSVADKDVEPIDNKIEQAMDLVKSHLLLAVREEVDVLKANITKLVDRIGSLERENAVLRGSVSADVLAQLEVPSTTSSATTVSSSSSVTPTGPLSRV